MMQKKYCMPFQSPYRLDVVFYRPGRRGLDVVYHVAMALDFELDDVRRQTKLTKIVMERDLRIQTALLESNVQVRMAKTYMNDPFCFN